MTENSRIYTLLNYAITDANVFAPTEKLNDELVQICLELWNRDNVCTTLNNYKGSLCSTYPCQLIIPIKQKIQEKTDYNIDKDFATCKDFKDLVTKGRFARTRGRFPIPVLLVEDKFVCRSSTLARSPEIYTRTSLQYFIPGETMPQTETFASSKNGDSVQNCDPEANGLFDKSKVHAVNGINKRLGSENNVSKNHKLAQSNVNSSEQNKEWLLDKMRKTDIDILHNLRVNMICDLMVENKKVKYGLNVTSSEKVDRLNRYGDFHLLSIPYPGCEFFADYSNNNYKGTGLKFDWKQDFVDAEFQIPKKIADLQGIDWKDYMQWDLVTLTQNYFKLLLRCLILSDSSGILLHCISGWDRTPLFISLLRLSLWADGLIHQSLNAEEMVYLTLAYDWLLFSHQFSDRINKREEIMHFCFKFLHDITSPEYSLLPLLEKNSNLSSGSKEDIDKTFVKMDSSHTTMHGMSECLHDVNNEKGLNDYPDFEEMYGRGECKSAECKENCDKPLLDLQNVENCLSCLIENASSSHLGDNAVVDNCAVSEKENSKHMKKYDSSLSKSLCKNSSAAILPLNVSDNVSPNPISPHHKLSEIHHENGESPQPDDSITSLQHPNTTGFETSNEEVFNTQNGIVSEVDAISKSGHVLSDDQSLLDFSLTKSEPIPVPKKCLHRTSVESSISSSVSNPALTFEPGGSWQLISTSPPGISAAVDANSSASSTIQSLRNNSFNSVPHTVCNCGTELNLKFEKRREKLKMAYNLMIPAYIAVVQKQKQQQEQSGFFQSLVHFVKRT